MLLKRFIDIFGQCKQLFDNKRLQLSSCNNKLKLKINYTIYKKVAFKNYIFYYYLRFKIFKIFKILIILIILTSNLKYLRIKSF